MIVSFPGVACASPAEVGGKAAALIRLSAAGLPVPAGEVVGADFFAPWYAMLAADAPALATDPEALAARALDLPLDGAQRRALELLRERLGRFGGAARFAVRSSAADEDAVDASFAGMYQTLLGVHADAVEPALRHCFAASLAPALVAYRRERGLAEAPPRFALIVQQQIDSEIAGVGFSLNPVTNDHDEAVFAASWGLGTAVVDGRVTPDQYVLDKLAAQLVSESRGDKRVADRLGAADIERDCPEPRAAERVLDDAQLHALLTLISAVETLFGAAVDIEWAWADGRLHLLQARPITTGVPLPASMMTAPGAPRRLYLDAALSKGMTSNVAFSPLGLDQVERLFGGLIERWLGRLRPGPRVDAPEAIASAAHDPHTGALIFFDGGRMYMNVSDLLWFMSPQRLAASHAPTDRLTADILAGIELARYGSRSKPAWLRADLLWRLPRMLWRVRGLFTYMLGALIVPTAAEQRYRHCVDAMSAQLQALRGDDRPLEELQREMTASMAAGFPVLMGGLLVGLIPVRGFVDRRADPVAVEKLSRGTRGDVVVEMGLALHRLTTLLDPAEFDDLPGLADRLERRALPAAFLHGWDAFIATYGWRGADEMDVASPRYADDPAIALRQMAFMATAGGFDLQAAHGRFVTERAAARATLEAALGPLRRALLRRVLRLHECFAGTRDTPKHINVLCNYLIRERARREGARLVAAGRLDAIDDVFDLTFDDLRAAADPGLDLRARRAQRTAFLRRLRRQVKAFPPLIDSRGRILRAPPKVDAPGVLVGMPVSAGVIAGPVKVLRSAHEKDVVSGDILVAYCTDPGWTPLFVNAGAIVLEVGGMLQHGAVVAREFGKPCVVGIAGVVDSLRDGEWVEIDGAAGTLTRRPAPS